MNIFYVKDKYIIITAASSGQWHQIAQIIAKQGANILN